MQNIIRFLSFIFICSFIQANAQTDPKQSQELLAAQYYQNKEYDKAAELYEELFNKNPSPYYYTPFFNSLIQLKDYEKAEKAVKKLIKKSPDDLSYITDLGFLYDLEGDKKKSEKTYESAIKSITFNENQIFGLANSFVQKGLFDYAIKTYTEARKISDGNLPFFLEIAEIYQKKQDFQSMLEIYMQALAYSEQYIEPIQNRLQDFISDDSDNKKMDFLKQIVLRAIQKNSDKVIYSELMIWLAVQSKDFEAAFVQSKALDKKFKEDGKRVFDLANIALENDSYNIARQCYKYVISKGDNGFFYLNSKIALVNTEYKRICAGYSVSTDDLNSLKSEFQSTITELGISANTMQLVLDYAHFLAFYMHNTKDAIENLNQIIEIPNAQPKNKALAKIELADILLLTGDIWESTLLYSQVDKAFKSEPIGHEAKFKNAKLSYYRGEFFWALAQLDVLKAATSKLIANDALQLSLLISDNIEWDSSLVELTIYARADLLFFQNKYDSALLRLDSIKSVSLNHPINDEVLFKKAQIYSNQGNYEKAISYLEQITIAYPDDILGDDALFLMAEMYQKKLNNTEKAKEIYKSFLEKYTGSVYTTEARKRYRALRGDAIN
ncbi:MAG: tetratricopeptide repeat protein [Bacteroidota bacterium]